MDDIGKIFHAESEKLKDGIDRIMAGSQYSAQEIVAVYYQVINLQSIITVLKLNASKDDNKTRSDKITETENLISKKFNLAVHPQIVAKLENSIRETAKNLQSDHSVKQSTQDIQRDAKLYEDLREQMSTKEFVQQYQRSIS